MFSRNWLTMAIVIGLATSLQAQPRGGPVQLTGVQIEGKIDQVGRGGVFVTAATGQKWAVKIPAKAEVKVTGTADPDFLSPGMYVRFSASIDKRNGRATEPVKMVTIITPSATVRERMLGVQRFNDAAFGSGPGEAGGAPNAGGPGVGPGVAVPDAVGPGAGRAKGPRGAAAKEEAVGPQDFLPPDTPEKKPARGKKRLPIDEFGDAPAAPATVEMYDIRGQVISFKNGKLGVSAPNQYFKAAKLNVELDEDAEVLLDMVDYSIAKAGDTAKILGFYAQVGSAEAKEVEITLAEQLTKPGKKSKRGVAAQPRTPHSRVKKPEAADDLLGKEEKAKPGAKAEDAEKGDTPEALREILEMTAEEMAGKPNLMVTLGGENLTFSPCKSKTAEQIERRFGRPDFVSNLNANIPDEKGQPKPVQWRILGYGNGTLKIFVDEDGKTVYMNWSKPQEKPKEE